MRVALTIETNSELERLNNGLRHINDRLELFFQDRSYGEDVERILIGMILTGPRTEELHPVRPLKYRKISSFKNPITGEQINMNKLVTFDVKPDYEITRRLNAEEAAKYISKCIVQAADQLIAARKRFPKFDAVQFRRDLEALLVQT